VAAERLLAQHVFEIPWDLAQIVAIQAQPLDVGLQAALKLGLC
jgi:hypothetical protein